MRVKILILCLFACFTLPALATNTDVEMVKITRNQMVLSQKITKLYFMLGANLKTEQTRQALNSAIREFESGNITLKEFAKNTGLADDVRLLTLTWQAYKSQLQQPFNLAKASELLQANEQLANSEQNFLLDLQKQYAITLPEVVQTIDQQRVLSQKIATYYVALYAGAPVPDLDKSFTKSVEKYDQGLSDLINRADNSTEVKKYLSKTKGQWEFSKSGLAYQKSGQFTPYVILATTDAMQKSMDTVATEYLHSFLPQNRLTSAKLDF